MSHSHVSLLFQCVLWHSPSVFLPFFGLQVLLLGRPHQPILCFARQRQRSLLSVVACWDSSVMDAMWVAAVRVRNGEVPDLKLSKRAEV